MPDFKPCEFPTMDEMVPGRQFDFMGFRCWWTGWKQDQTQMVYVGQWIAMDLKTKKGYSYTLPGKTFSELKAVEYSFNNSSSDYFQVTIDRSYRNSLVRQGRRTLKKKISEAERAKVMQALGEKKPKINDQWDTFAKGSQFQNMAEVYADKMVKYLEKIQKEKEMKEMHEAAMKYPPKYEPSPNWIDDLVKQNDAEWERKSIIKALQDAKS